MQIVTGISPNNRAVVMIATILLRESNRFGETSILRIISDQHGIRFPLATLPWLGVSIINDVKSVVQEDRLRSLSAIVEHLDLTISTKRQEVRAGL
ncbi:MAG: hypothetical protein COA78_16105 [Blastopirellula sp.]|nr:MAG: hypothetical protein COA78_16105 [Blastopirellula sp.]